MRIHAHKLIGAGIREKAEREKNGGAAVRSIERAVTRETKKWEDDTESESDGSTQIDGGGEESGCAEDEAEDVKGKGKLVDI